MRNLFKKYCSTCARCCKNWTIFITFKEREKIKRKIGLDYNEFSEFSEIPNEEFMKYSKYGHFYNLANKRKILQLKKVEGICIFLNNENKCSIYSVRPYICKLFPFWFNKNKEPVFCIGRPICPIPDEVLIRYKEKNLKMLKKIIVDYLKCIKDYKEKTKNCDEVWINIKKFKTINSSSF